MSKVEVFKYRFYYYSGMVRPTEQETAVLGKSW